MSHLKREIRKRKKEKNNSESNATKRGRKLIGNIKEGRKSQNVPKCTIDDPKSNLQAKKIIP